MKIVEGIRKDIHKFTLFECFIVDRPTVFMPNLALWVPADNVYHNVQLQIMDELSDYEFFPVQVSNITTAVGISQV